MAIIRLTLIIHEELRPLLSPRLRKQTSFFHALERKASIKDLLESFRIPHTEIGSLLVNSHFTDFSYHVKDTDQIEVLPPSAPPNNETDTEVD